MKLLLIYGTSEGQTKKISGFVADRLAQGGHETTVLNAAESDPAADPSDFDAVIIAASVHEGHYQSAIVSYVREHRAAIDLHANAFLSVSLAAPAMIKTTSRDSRSALPLSFMRPVGLPDISTMSQGRSATPRTGS